MPLALTPEPQPCDATTIQLRYTELTAKGFVFNPTTRYWDRVDCCLSDDAVRYVDEETWQLLVPGDGGAIARGL